MSLNHKENACVPYIVLNDNFRLFACFIDGHTPTREDSKAKGERESGCHLIVDVYMLKRLSIIKVADITGRVTISYGIGLELEVCKLCWGNLLKSV